MNIVCKHLAMLLVFLLLVGASGLGKFSEDDEAWQYLPSSEIRKSRGHREVGTRQGRSFQSQVKSKTSNKTAVQNPRIFIRNVTGQTGNTAILHCEVGLLRQNDTVIWMKKKENDTLILLTVNNITHTRDKRFKATNEVNAKDWELHIRYTQNSDGGIYECQICRKRKNWSTKSTSSLFFRLKLVEAHAEILGGGKKVVKAGNPLRLTCVLKRSIQAPIYIFWYHLDRMINYDLGDGAEVRHGRQGKGSELIFPKAEARHAGNYSCVPSNAGQASVFVDVLSSESKKAATQHGNRNSGGGIVNMLLLFVTFLFYR